jgi:hypothetical protein
MRIPQSFKAITLSGRGGNLPWAPQGFHGIEEFELGNGDVFGLYWPFGREDEEPIVAETQHDSGAIAPYWSSLERFLAATNGDESSAWAPTLLLDANSPDARLTSARECLSRNDLATGVEHLESAVRVLPEFGAAQYLLATQYRRAGRNEDAIRSAIQALISPLCFWPPSPQMSQLVKWLSRQQSCPEDLRHDPIWKNRGRLKYQFGGQKENDDYVVIRDAIEEYLSLSQFISALTLMESYRELMRCETVSFQERYEFNPDEYRARQDDVAAKLYGKARMLDL